MTAASMHSKLFEWYLRGVLVKALRFPNTLLKTAMYNIGTSHIKHRRLQHTI